MGEINNAKEEYNFKFGKVFDQNAKQDDIFDKVAVEAVTNALDGFNSTVFAYGQTGSGKTFTITGGAERYDDRGIIPRVLTYLFKHYAEVAAGRGHPPPAGACPISPTSRGSLRPSPSGRPFPSP